MNIYSSTKPGWRPRSKRRWCHCSVARGPGCPCWLSRPPPSAPPFVMRMLMGTSMTMMMIIKLVQLMMRTRCYHDDQRTCTRDNSAKRGRNSSTRLNLITHVCLCPWPSSLFALSPAFFQAALHLLQLLQQLQVILQPLLLALGYRPPEKMARSK